ncbi:opsin Rh5 [Teleopsis dalmanni]|uniref:opsin Rh5 n=1 Tax=Teleopsis dalmanni TaxID=139649 RepID=UPI0018CC7C39|nr:opsin Rh5 [Teleopsis dalmanni]
MHSTKGAMGPEAYTNFANNSLRDGGLPLLGWNHPSEYQHLVHQHWRNFPAPQIHFTAFFFIGYIILMFISLFGNGLVIWIFGTSKNLRTPSNLLIFNLAIFDLVMCCNMPHYLINTIAGYFIGGELSCDVYAVLGGISGMGAAISNAFIAFDRYRTISNPIDGRLNFAQVGFLIAFCWVWTIPFSVLPFFKIWGRYTAEGYLTTCSFDYLTDNDETRLFVRSMFAWAYCFPMIMICTYYTKLFLHVRDHERMLAEQAKKMNVKSLSANANTESMSVEMRIAKAAIMIWMLYVVAWTPYATVSLLGTSDNRQAITPFVSMLPATAAKAVSCFDPWVYAASHPKYRLELERRLPWLGIRERNIQGGGSAATCNDSEAGTVMVES